MQKPSAVDLRRSALVLCASAGPVIEHFGLWRGVLERTGGRKVKNLGDGLMLVFDRAAQSLACAVGIQKAVEARNRRTE
jgi:class 3 adenylate cyclase